MYIYICVCVCVCVCLCVYYISFDEIRSFCLPLRYLCYRYIYSFFVVAVLAVLLIFWPLSYMYVLILSSRNDLEDQSLARLYRFR